MKTKIPISFLFLSLVISCSRKEASEEIIIGMNEGIHHDDFEYVVTHYQVQKKIGDGDKTLVAKGNFYIITFKTINNAMRVKHEWDNSVAYLVDESGNRYENDSTAQIILDNLDAFGWRDHYVTEHQTVQSTKFVFDLPESVKQPFLMVRGSTLMGDFLDGGKFEKTKVKLFE